MSKFSFKFIKYIFILLFAACVCVYAQQNEINQQAKQLSNIEQNLKQKQAEQIKLLRDERTVKRDLDFLNDSIKKTEKRLKDIASDIKSAEQNLSVASKNYNDASQSRELWNQTILDDIWLFNKTFIVNRYEKSPIEYKIRQEAIKSKKNKFDSENRRAVLSSSDVNKWQKAKNDLLLLKDREGKLVNERQSLIEEKNKLFKTTSNQRKKAEAEIRELQNSAKALQKVMQDLVRESKRREQQRLKEVERKSAAIKAPAAPAPSSDASLRPRAEITRARSQADSKKRKLISPPVSGRVVLNFGRNKHEELDTYIISNGIKMKAADRSDVRSVESGVVVYLGQFRSYGNVVIIDHSSFFAIYGQLNRIYVKDNQSVKRGEAVGQLGSGENSVLYFEIRRDNVPDNPILWFKR
ncbi:MAG: peptidoglycan DD-metalloendopeptidase family protein [Elusimicrobiota bacterium]|jgi:septal ring factor EnvC (AmiA/AmiB activator)|nr:peptidoglycan DD-metalloendopeptidase family protein [Elusimicrobiota bacterium]